MNQIIKQKWLEALRSGKYKQGRLALKTTDEKYCCLGVLCEVVAETDEGKRLGLKFDEGGRFDGDTMYLGENVCRIAELKTALGARLPYIGNDLSLPTLNDSRGLSFVEIADLIEAHL